MTRVPFWRSARRPPAIFTLLTKKASRRTTSRAFSSIQMTPPSFWMTFSTRVRALNSGFGSKSKTRTSWPRKRSRRGLTNWQARGNEAMEKASFSFSFVFFFLGFGGERLAVDFHEGGDFGAIEVKESGFADVRLFGFALAFVPGFFFDLGAGVIFFNFVEGLLVGVNLLEEGFEIGELHLRFSGEIEDAFADGFVDGGVGDVNRVDCGAAVQFDFVGELDAIFGAVVVVEDFLVLAAYWRGLFDYEVQLGVEEYLPLRA